MLEILNCLQSLSFVFPDAGCVQVSAHFEKGFESQTRHASALRAQAVKDANQVFRAPMAKIKHENHERHLHQSQTSFK